MSHSRSKTTSENLEARFDAGEDVLHFFDFEKARVATKIAASGSYGVVHANRGEHVVHTRDERMVAKDIVASRGNNLTAQKTIKKATTGQKLNQKAKCRRRK